MSKMAHMDSMVTDLNDLVSGGENAQQAIHTVAKIWALDDGEIILLLRFWIDSDK